AFRFERRPLEGIALGRVVIREG
ncbi:MAG: hypothetical protein QOG77_1150, partial [Solirubrobacteraceae bacterium]|nr:hypothetical protein [Solirubrobacteraceae bacterium]